MSRELRFRAWEKDKRKMSETFSLLEGMVGDLFFPIKDYELMQYTGLEDKNGTDVYEGDVVAIDMWHGNEHGYIPEDGVIKWHQPSSAFKWFSLEEDPSDGNNFWLSQADEKQREVIGNIYEDQGRTE